MERPAEDRRVRRTRQALLQALIELTTEQGYEHVTVQGIAERANVGRTTFYAHFRDKEELLEKSIEGMFAALHERPPGDAPDEGLLPTRALFEHVQENAHLVKAFGGTALLHEHFQRQLVAVIERRLAALAEAGHATPLPPTVAATYFAGALMALVWWWLRQRRPYRAEEMARMFDALAASSLGGAPPGPAR